MKNSISKLAIFAMILAIIGLGANYYLYRQLTLSQTENSELKNLVVEQNSKFETVSQRLDGISHKTKTITESSKEADQKLKQQFQENIKQKANMFTNWLLPNEKGMFETYSTDLNQGFSLRIKSSRKVNPDYLRGLISNQGAGLTLLFVSEEHHLIPLYKYEIISKLDYNNMEVQPEIISENGDYYLTRKLLQQETSGSEAEEIAGDYALYLKKKENVNAFFLTEFSGEVDQANEEKEENKNLTNQDIKAPVEIVTELENMIENISNNKNVTIENMKAISASDSFKKSFLQSAIELSRSQVFHIAGEEVITLRDYMEADKNEQKAIYQKFMNMQKSELGKVIAEKKQYSKVYEKDGIAYVYVKAPYKIDKVKLKDKEYKIKDFNLYRRYLCQKVEDQWQVNDYEVLVDIAEKDIKAAGFEDFAAKINKEQKEKFFTVFGEKVEF